MKKAKNRDGNYRMIWDIACQTVDDAESSGKRIVSSLIAGDMAIHIDPNRHAPELEYYAAIQHYVQIVCKVCRERWGDTDDPAGETFKQGMLFEEFGSRLQARYPVRITDGETEYRHIDQLTDIDVKRLSKRMRRIGSSYYESADQLERYHESREMTGGAFIESSGDLKVVE